MSSENRSGDLDPENGVVTDGDARHASPPHDEARGKDDLGIRIGAVVVVALLSRTRRQESYRIFALS